MRFQRLVVLLPSNSLEDLSLKREPDEADQLLAAWSALWHPSLLASAESIPSWVSAESPPSNPAEHLIVVPPCTEDLLPPDWVDEVESAGAVILRNQHQRGAILQAVLPRLDENWQLKDTEENAELVANFLALGVGQFWIEVLTRQQRYMTTLDEGSLQHYAVRAAQAAVAGNIEDAQSELEGAYQLLPDAREYFYPVEAHLLDLTLVTPQTIGAALRDQLTRPWPSNLLATAETIEAMAQREPATLEALIDALENGTASIIGGEYRESMLPLLDPEGISRQFEYGLKIYQQYLNQQPTTFGRRRFGLTLALPQILHKHGFTGGLHFTLDDGRFPTGNQSRITWKGDDKTTLEMLARVPLDAGRSETFLQVSERLAEIFDIDQSPTLVFAHWPGHESPWYEDLQRFASQTNALGTFCTMADYWDETGSSGPNAAAKYSADEYRSPYLRQAVDRGQADPISRHVRYYRRRTAAENLATLAMLCASLGSSKRHLEARSVSEGQLLDEVENSLEDVSPTSDLDAHIDAELQAELKRFASLLGNSASPVLGQLLVKGTSFAWQESVAASPPPAPLPARRWWQRSAKPAKAPPPLAEENVLRNEFFEVVLNPTSGGIQSVSDYQSRGSRLGQQIALRSPRARKVHRDEWGSQREDLNYAYSLMAADEMLVTAATPEVGEITTRGRLMDRSGELLARFVQTTRVRQGSRILELEIELDPIHMPAAGSDPWQSYYGVRFAWSDESATLHRSVSMASRPTEATRIEAPHFVEVRSKARSVSEGQTVRRTAILCGGLPYHRRNGQHMLDTLLIVPGETARKFCLGVGFDLPCPMPAALEWLSPRLSLSDVASPAAASGWLFHLDVRNVLATHWMPVTADDGRHGGLPNKRVVGFRVRLLETEGRPVSPRLRSFRNLATANLMSGIPLAVAGDCVTIELKPYEWAEIECRWE